MLRCFGIWLLFAAASVAAETGLLGRGTSWETAWHGVDSGKPGPVVVVVGGVHGDEAAGARAAEQIRHWPIRKGRLVVLPRANRSALEVGSRRIPGAEKSVADLNRNFPRASDEGGPRGERATAIWNWLVEREADWVVDLHEGYHFHAIQPKSVGSTVIDVGGEDCDAVVPKILEAVNATVAQPERRFQRLGPPIDGSLARAAAARLGCRAMIFETTTRDQRLSTRVRQQRRMLHALLVHLGMLDADAPSMPRPPAEAFAVALYDAGGVGGAGPRQVEAVLRSVPETMVWRVGAEDLKEGALEGGAFDLVVFPGGSGSKQAAALGEVGRAAVREFVGEGGGYVGICAGAYLAASNYEWSLGLSNHKTFCEVFDIPGEGRKSMWYRGASAEVRMALSEEGREILGGRTSEFAVRYHNGPIVSAAGHAELPEYRVWAWFRSEVSRYAPQEGTMVDTPAIIASEFREGRVVCISPHPESMPALRPMVARAMAWAAGQ